jgi:hypothetical protein
MVGLCEPGRQVITASGRLRVLGTLRSGPAFRERALGARRRKL